MRRLLGWVALCCATVQAFELPLPPGFPLPAVPADNPVTQQKVDLGRRLFFDAGLSENGGISCASCHDPARAYADGRSRPVGARGEALPRNAPSLVNVAYVASLGWLDEGVTTLEAQMAKPLFATAPVEMGLAGRELQVLARLREDRSYRLAFAAAFPDEDDPLSITNLVKAIASFERTLLSGRSAFDRYVFDDERGAMSPAARRGMALFYSKRAACAECHGGPAFAGTLRVAGREEVAPLFAATGVAPGKFKVPGLRNVALTAPYMHDGSLPTLAAVIDFYDRGGGRGALKRLHLTPREKGDLLAFLGSLTDPR
jgi:cytochrome c peroxidase